MMVFCAGVFCIACSAYFQAKGFFSLYFLFNGGLGASVHWCEGVFIGDAFLHFSSSLYPRSLPIFHCKVLFILQFATFEVAWRKNMCSP